MKLIKQFSGLVILLLLFINCNNNKNKQQQLVVELDAVIKKTDSIHTFYKTDGTINFNEIESFWTKVKGNNKNQNIKIVFPKNVKPNQIRLDFGNNIKQEEIVLNKVVATYKSNKFILKGKEIYYYLRVDESNTFLDKNLGVLKRLNPKQKTGPSLYPNGEFLKKKLVHLLYSKEK